MKLFKQLLASFALLMLSTSILDTKIIGVTDKIGNPHFSLSLPINNQGL